jgi:arylsulfatase A-like enzyme
VTNLAVGQLDRLKASGKPYFLWVHYLDPHAPYEPPGPYRGRFQNDEHFDPAVCIPLSDKPKQQMLGIGSERMLDGRDDLAFYVARYDAEVAYTDEQIGRLLAEMRRRGLLRKTLTVFTADHGESLGEHGYCFLPLILSAACGHGHTAREERRPLTEAAEGWNVVLLTVDTLRADRLGAYGYRARQNSPRIDAQLAAGVVFDNATAQRASTWPSLASLLTGLYPGAHGIYENGYGFPDALPTLPKLLHTAGYQTGAFLSNMCQAIIKGGMRLPVREGTTARVCAGRSTGHGAPRANGRSSSGSTSWAPIRRITTAATARTSLIPATVARSAPARGYSIR